MAHLNTAQLIYDATKGLNRAYAVQQDPAARKSWGVALSDVNTAAASVMDAISETRAAWRRAGLDGVDTSPAYA